jgi:hypothetical protein
MPWFVIVQSATEKPDHLTVWTRFPVGTERYAYVGSVSHEDFAELKEQHRVVVAKWLKKYVLQPKQ